MFRCWIYDGGSQEVAENWEIATAALLYALPQLLEKYPLIDDELDPNRDQWDVLTGTGFAYAVYAARQ